MSTVTPNQSIIIPVGADAANNPLAFTDMIGGVENRLVQRYTSTVDRAARNPAPTAGELSFIAGTTWYERYTGAKWLPCTAVMAVKTANQIVNNSTAFVNDTQLVVPIPTLSTTYAFDLTIAYLASTTSDIKFQFTVPAGAAFSFGGYGAATGIAAITGDANFAWGTTAAFGGSGFDMITTLHGTLVSAGTAGNLQLQWAQNALDASNTTVYSRSWMRLMAIA